MDFYQLMLTKEYALQLQKNKGDPGLWGLHLQLNSAGQKRETLRKGSFGDAFISCGGGGPEASSELAASLQVTAMEQHSCSLFWNFPALVFL